MFRIVDGMAFEGQLAEGVYDVTLHDLGNGHREAVVRQAVYWQEVPPIFNADPDWLRDQQTLTDEEHAAKVEANRKRAARRAKTRCRRLVKALGCDSLLTLTYRANQEDRELCMRHLKEFVRRMRRVLPGFAYVAALERQKRGAWHVHMAIHRLPRVLPADGVRVHSWQVVRAVWRGVVGDLGGNVDERRRKWASGHSASKLAGYLSKYMLKAFEDGDAWINRFSASAHSIPAPVRQRFEGVSLGEMVSLVYAFAADGACTISTVLSRFKDMFFLASEGLPDAKTVLT